MAEETEDPREVAWHPRHAAELVGHSETANRFYRAFDDGKPHHAWLLTGPQGIGKATLAYRLAGHVLGQKNQAQAARWIGARSHPDLFVLERKLGDTKPRKLKTEFKGKALTYYGRWTYKYEEAARRGAIGAILIHKTEMASYGWDVVRNSWSGERSYLRADSRPKLKVASWIHLGVAQKLAQAAGLDVDKMISAAQSREHPTASASQRS